MKNRLITVPKTIKAELALDLNQANPEDLFELILSEKDFDYLENEGVFDLFNDIDGVIVDDYESEMLKNIEDLNSLLDSFKKKLNLMEDQVLVKKIIFLIEQAIECKTGVYFYF